MKIAIADYTTELNALTEYSNTLLVEHSATYGCKLWVMHLEPNINKCNGHGNGHGRGNVMY